MLEAIRRPRYRVESLRLNRAAIDQALAVGAISNALQCLAHLPQDRRVQFRFREVFAFGQNAVALDPELRRRVEELLASKRDFAGRSV